MANEREQAMEYEMNEFSRRIEMPLGEGQKQAFRAGWSNAFRYAAATAEGIPQADGWVAIKSIADLAYWLICQNQFSHINARRGRETANEIRNRSDG